MLMMGGLTCRHSGNIYFVTSISRACSFLAQMDRQRIALFSRARPRRYRSEISFCGDFQRLEKWIPGVGERWRQIRELIGYLVSISETPTTAILSTMSTAR